jgi:hypothetical protein
MDELREALIVVKAGVIGAAAILAALILRDWLDKPTLPPLAMEEPINRLGLEEMPLAGIGAWQRFEAPDRGDGQDRLRRIEFARDRLQIELDLQAISQGRRPLD